MTVGQYPGSSNIVPEFRELVDRYTEGLDLEEDSQSLLDAALIRGSAAVLSIPEGDQRDSAINDASERLASALGMARREFVRADRTRVDIDSMSAVMQSVCPVPPFCYGTDADVAGSYASPSQEYATAEPVETY